MGIKNFIRRVFRKDGGNKEPSKPEGQLVEIIEFLKSNERLRHQVLEDRINIIELTETIRLNEIKISEMEQKHQTEINQLQEHIELLETENNSFMEKINDLENIGKYYNSSNPTRNAIFSILEVRPKIRNRTIADLLNVTERTVRNHRNEYQKIRND